MVKGLLDFNFPLRVYIICNVANACADDRMIDVILSHAHAGTQKPLVVSLVFSSLYFFCVFLLPNII